MRSFEDHWMCGMLSGSPGSLLGANAKEAARFNWKVALEWAENQFVGNSAFEAEEAINKELRGD